VHAQHCPSVKKTVKKATAVGASSGDLQVCE
jgi:hypothetical protein